MDKKYKLVQYVKVYKGKISWGSYNLLKESNSAKSLDEEFCKVMNNIEHYISNYYISPGDQLITEILEGEDEIVVKKYVTPLIWLE